MNIECLCVWGFGRSSFGSELCERSFQNIGLFSVHVCLTEQRTTAQGQVYYLHKQTGVSTWHDPRVPRDLSTTTVCPDDLGPLPPGWEIRHTATGRCYYVDHNNRTTQFTDPRLAANVHVIQQRNTYVQTKIFACCIQQTTLSPSQIG